MQKITQYNDWVVNKAIAECNQQIFFPDSMLREMFY